LDPKHAAGRFRTVSPLLVALAALAVFAMTLQRTLPAGDSGELIAVAWNGGVAHPPGYPLYTLLAGAWARVFAFGEPALRLAVFSAVCMAAAAGLLAAALRKLGFVGVGGRRGGAGVGLLRAGLEDGAGGRGLRAAQPARGGTVVRAGGAACRAHGRRTSPRAARAGGADGAGSFAPPHAVHPGAAGRCGCPGRLVAARPAGRGIRASRSR
jgi:hypothetical protein